MSTNVPCLLAIDTSTAYLSLGIHFNGHNHCFYEHVGTQQSNLILPKIAQLLSECHIDTKQINAIVYAQGPGAFTGLRIGIGVAEGLATPNNTPLIGIPCLDAVATCAPKHNCVLVATDARMGELFYAWYDVIQNKCLSDYCVGPASEIRLPEGIINGIGVGNAFDLNIHLPVAGKPTMPTAEQYLKLALSGRYPHTPPELAELRYVRNKIALTATEQAKRRIQ